MSHPYGDPSYYAYACSSAHHPEYVSHDPHHYMPIDVAISAQQSSDPAAYAHAQSQQYAQSQAGLPAPSGLPAPYGAPVGTGLHNPAIAQSSTYPMYRGPTPAPYRHIPPQSHAQSPPAAPPYSQYHIPTPVAPVPMQQPYQQPVPPPAQPQQQRYVYSSYPPPALAPAAPAMPSEDRPFACRYCSKSFARENDFRRHESGHSGEKPYICSCGNAYARKDALKRHKDTSGHP